MDGLLTRLDAGGHAEAAAELRRGFSCLNGLTDGWALFLESIEKVEAEHAARFAGERAARARGGAAGGSPRGVWTALNEPAAAPVRT